MFCSKTIYVLKFYFEECYPTQMMNGRRVARAFPRGVHKCTSCRGQTLVEYALIIAIISVVAVSVMITLGKEVTGVYSMVTSVVASAQASH